MTERPAVDVVVVTWNTRDLTVSALRRLCDSEQDADLRVLVHDNASADGTADAVRRDLPDADVVVADRNLGFAGGVNAALQRATAPWLLLLNSDAWPEPHAIGRLVECAQRHPRAAAVAPRLVDADDHVELSAHDFPSVRLAARTALRPRMPSYDQERRVDWAVGAALLVRREALDEIGGLDDSYFMYAEDLDWCWRAARHGWEIWFTPAATVRHLRNASGEQAYGDDRARAVAASTYRFYRRAHGPASTSAFRAFNVAGAARALAGARLRADAGRASYWRLELRAHLHPAQRPGR